MDIVTSLVDTGIMIIDTWVTATVMVMVIIMGVAIEDIEVIGNNQKISFLGNENT